MKLKIELDNEEWAQIIAALEIHKDPLAEKVSTLWGEAIIRASRNPGAPRRRFDWAEHVLYPGLCYVTLDGKCFMNKAPYIKTTFRKARELAMCLQLAWEDGLGK